MESRCTSTQVLYTCCYTGCEPHTRTITSASRVVFLDGKPAPHLYRNFNLRTVEGSCDDYAGLQEVLGRRLKGLTANAEEVAWERPDLLVIDGGKGQLGAVVDVMNRLHEDIPESTSHSRG